jgi:hypothetical protein
MYEGTGPAQAIQPAESIDLGNTIEFAISAAAATEAGDAGAVDQPEAAQPNPEAPMTAEAARRLAVALAPHLMAMRAVTAGTRYGTRPEMDQTGEDAAEAPQPSAATRIFIAGMLERISA